MSKLLGIVLLVIAIPQYVKAQNVEKLITDYYLSYPQEKVYVHFDKESYAPGQTIWFKSYLLHNGLPGGLSSNFYVLLLNAKGDVLASKMYPVTGAAATGNIDLPLNLAEGDYFFHAATSNSVKHNTSLVYSKKIGIYKNGNHAAKKNEGVLSEMIFYPESGNLVDGILTVVAFTSKDAAGSPVAVNGNIINSSGVKVPFKTYYAGMGKVQFRPKAGQTYFAEVLVNGKPERFALPAVKASGVNLRVEDEPGGKQFLLSRMEKDANDLNNITLVVQMEGRVVYNNNIAFNDYPSVKGHLITDSLPSGILHFTVFNNKMEPIAERLSFVNNKEYLSSNKIEVEKAVNDGSYNIKVYAGNDVASSLSTSVSEQNNIAAPDIITYFLLSGNIKNEVADAATLFKLRKDSAQAAIDNLMVTTTLKDFNWQKILSGSSKLEVKQDDFINIKGIVEDLKEKTAVKGGTLNISLVDEDSTIKNFSVPVDAQGGFMLDSMVFFGAGKFYYNYNNSAGKKRNVKVKLAEQQDKSISFVNIPEVQGKAVTFNYPLNTANNEANVKELEDVTVYAKNKRLSEQVNEIYTSGLFKNKGKIVIDNINEPYNNQSINVLRYIQLNLNTVKFQNGKFVNTKNFSMNTMQYWEVGVLLDEVLTTVGNLSSINMTDVALIKFYEAGFAGVSSNTSPGGAIAIYLKKNEGAKEVKVATEDYFWYNGYSVVKKFEPEVNNIQNFTKQKTVYWNPAVYTSVENKLQVFPFQKQIKDQPLKIVVQGFDDKGRLIYFEKVLTD